MCYAWFLPSWHLYWTKTKLYSFEQNDVKRSEVKITIRSNTVKKAEVSPMAVCELIYNTVSTALSL